MINILSSLLAKSKKEDIDFYTLPFPTFATDTRSSLLQARFELDVRNDRHLALWKERWRQKMFSEGTYGLRPFEETVSHRRLAIDASRSLGVEAVASAQSAKVLGFKGSYAA